MVTTSIDRALALERYRSNRRRSAELFELIPDGSYHDRPIDLRHPICFYEGHLPAFAVNTLVKRALGGPAIDEEYEALFERGIDPEEPPRGAGPAWPARADVQAYGRAADGAIETAIGDSRVDGRAGGHPSLAGGQALWTVLEHEVMHHETLHYMWRRLPYDRKRGRPAGGGADAQLPVPGPASAPRSEMVRIPAGRAVLGVELGDEPFTWDNERPRRVVDVPAFEIAVHDVTNEEYLEFVEAGGYRDEAHWDRAGWRWVRENAVAHPPFWERTAHGWSWIGLFERSPLPAAWPVWVTHAEASAYARWRGMRLPSEAEYDRAAYGSPAGDRRYPWGDEPPGDDHGNFGFRQVEPLPVGSFPAGASAWGVHDLVGNGWEWTSSPFEPFPGFEPMASYPSYSADFFDGGHFVLKGASPVTGVELVRRSFRNWFRPRYPHVYAAFRCARGVS